MKNYGAILLLAAGQSSRLGRCKLIQKIGDKVLIQHIIDNLEYECQIAKFVVTGAYHQELVPYLSQDIDVIYNDNWQNGMGSSISRGIEVIEDKLSPSFVIICLADQIFLKIHQIEELVRSHDENPDKIVLSKYTHAQGPPCLFPRKYFGELAKLNNDNGAKDLISSNLDQVKYIDFKYGDYDIDTEDDYLEIVAMKEAKSPLF